LCGDAVVEPTVTRRLLERYVGTGPVQAARPSSLETLTEHEREVLSLVAHGFTNAEIASRLFLSEGTVKTHVHRILSELELGDRVQAVVFAYESGLVRSGAGETQ
jgi:DNA-binding NarL/FixJ family response regulator